MDKPEEWEGVQHHQTGWQEREARNLRKQALSRSNRPQMHNGATRTKGEFLNPLGNPHRGIPASAVKAPVDAQADVSKRDIGKPGPTQYDAANPVQQPQPQTASTSVHAVATPFTMDESKLDVASRPRPTTGASAQADDAEGCKAKVESVILVPHAQPLGRSSISTADLRKSSASNRTVVAPIRRSPLGLQTSVCTHI